METITEEMFSKELAQTHITHRLDIPIASLADFGVPEGERDPFPVAVMDEGGNRWTFRIAMRNDGHRKPVIQCPAWLSFVKMNMLRKDDVVTFYKIKNPANGEIIGYKVECELQPRC